jgi:hypothetical protein
MSRIANSLKSLTVALSLTALVGLVGCDAAPDAGAPAEQTDTAALNNGGLGTTGSGFCDPETHICTCVGDDECNDMFGSGVCKDQGSCDTSNPLQPVCTCTQALRVVKPKLGAVVIGKATTLSLAR